MGKAERLRQYIKRTFRRSVITEAFEAVVNELETNAKDAAAEEILERWAQACKDWHWKRVQEETYIA